MNRIYFFTIIFLFFSTARSMNCLILDDSTKIFDTLFKKESTVTYYGSKFWIPYHRVFYTYFENGRIKSKGRRSERRWNYGKWKFYYESGKIRAKGRYRRYTYHGKWIFYFESGAIKAKGNMYYGEMKGVWKLYNEEGKETIVNYE